MEQRFSHKSLKQIYCIIVSIILSVIIAIIIYQLFFNVNYSKKIEIKNISTDKSYINDKSNIGSDLVQINDKLFYNYNNDCFKYGLYVIGQNNTNRIWWDGFSFEPQCEISLTTIYKNHILNPIADSNSKYLDTNNENSFEIEGSYLNGEIVIREFDVDKGEYEEFLKIPNPDKVKFSSSFQVCDGYFYLFSIDNEIYRYNENYDKPLNIISKNDFDLSAFDMKTYSYFFGDDIYFLTLNNNRPSVCRYDINAQKQLSIVSLDGVIETENGIDNFIISGDGEGYFCVNNNQLYQINFVTKQIEKVYETDGALKVNLFNSKPVIAVEKSSEKNGIYVVYDLENIDRLTNTEACSIYNFDDIYIYYTDSFDKLYRVSVSNKKLENIFD